MGGSIPGELGLGRRWKNIGTNQGWIAERFPRPSTGEEEVLTGNRVQGKVAIVTGAGSSPGEGIGNGKATAVVFAREGASVMLVDIRPEAAEETRRRIDQEGGKSFVFKANVAEAKDCQAMAGGCSKP